MGKGKVIYPDFHLSGDTRYIQLVKSEFGSLWSQIQQMANNTIQARAVCDRYGRLLVEINPQLIPSASRTTPVIQHLEPQDYAGLKITRRQVNDTSRIIASGVAFDGANSQAFVSSAPGQMFKTHGRPETIQNLALVSQANTDLIAALNLANHNNPYPLIDLTLTGINRLHDVGPGQYITLDAGNNVRGLALDNLPMQIKRISHTYDPATGWFQTALSGEGYTDETTRLEGAPPSLPFSF
jgi:hypothetical protein